jgi:hypothetical protein
VRIRVCQIAGFVLSAYQLLPASSSGLLPTGHDKSIAGEVSAADDSFADKLFQRLVEEGVSAFAAQDILAPLCDEDDRFAFTLGAGGEELPDDTSVELHIKKYRAGKRAVGALSYTARPTTIILQVTGSCASVNELLSVKLAYGDNLPVNFFGDERDD